MASVSFDGVTGQVAFDEYGDTKIKVITVYKVDAGKWATGQDRSRQCRTAQMAPG